MQLRKQAITTVKERWEQQGIWRPCWEEKFIISALQGSQSPSKIFDEDDKWKHEFGDVLDRLEKLRHDEKALREGKRWVGSQEDLETRRKQLLFELYDLAHMTEAERSEWDRDTEASRPLNMFLYQITREGKELLDGGGAGKDDANTMAYKKVKERWERWGIWSQTWGLLPGMVWRHESLDFNLLRKDGASSDGEPPQTSDEASASSDTREKKRKRTEAR